MLAGGQSLLPLLKLRLAAAETLVDIGRLPGLRGVRRLEDGRLAIGALTTYAELLDSPARNYGLLGDALPNIGDVQVRNRGTIGGAIAHADPASDLPACLLALDGRAGDPVGGAASGRAAYDGFADGPFSTNLDPGELITEIRLPGPRDDAGSAYASLEQPASGYAMVGVAAVVFVGDGGKLVGANVAVTGVGDHAYRARAVETALAGSDGSADAIAAAAGHATDGRDRQQRHPCRPCLSDGDGRRLHPPSDRGRARPAGLNRPAAEGAGPARHAGSSRARAPRRGHPGARPDWSPAPAGRRAGGSPRTTSSRSPRPSRATRSACSCRRPASSTRTRRPSASRRPWRVPG